MIAFEDALEWLDGFWARYRSDLHGDCLATTYASCGAVMVVAARLQTRSVGLVAALTRLPVGFISEALTSLQRLEHALHAELLDLEVAVSQAGDNFQEVRDFLDFFMDRFWMAADEGFADRMQCKRRGVLIGGKSQDWIDQEDLEGFLSGLGDIKVGRRRRVRRCPRRLL